MEKSEMDGKCSMHGERRDACRFLAGKSEGKRALGIPRRKWEDNIKMDIQEMRWWYGLD
jgi:hypothetical protein